MQSFKIISEHKIIESNKKEVDYNIKKLQKQKADLSSSKSQLDVLYKNNSFVRYWKEFDPFKNEKKIVSKMGNTCNVSNAWLKCYELINYYNMLPEHVEGEFLHFDNAAFPGSFIISTYHFANTKRNWSDKYKWMGSSLITENELDKEPLEDKYHLYKNYKDNWIMDDNMNGDVLVKENQLFMHNKFKGSVDLYTSDIGFDVSSDYNNQELLQMPVNFGQVLSGLLILKKGGSFITKQYTSFESITVSLIYLASYFFDEFYVCKPYTSREANSETYLVGKGFRQFDNIMEEPYIKLMFSWLEKFTDISSTYKIPLFDAKYYSRKFLEDMIHINEVITKKTIEKVNEDIKRIKKCLINGNYKETHENPIVKEYNKVIEKNLIEWHMSNKVEPIPNNKKLNMVDFMNQYIR